MKGVVVEINRVMLKAIIFERGLRQYHVAKMMNISEDYFSQIINGKLLPSAKVVKKLCTVLNVSLTTFGKGKSFDMYRLRLRRLALKMSNPKRLGIKSKELIPCPQKRKQYELKKSNI